MIGYTVEHSNFVR